MVENEQIIFLWDFTIQVDRKLEHTRPDIVVFKKDGRDCQIIDVAIPGDYRINMKENEKILNYADLKLEISRMWNCKTTVIPIIIGALGSIPKGLKKHLGKLEVDCNITTLQKSALLGTAHILRKTLSV